MQYAAKQLEITFGISLALFKAFLELQILFVFFLKKFTSFAGRIKM